MFRHFATCMRYTHLRSLHQLLQHKNGTILFMALKPGVCGVDFFVQNVRGENCLVVPPVTLINIVLYYLYKQKALAKVVVPYWPSSYSWPVISKHLAHLIIDYKVFQGSEALTHGRSTNALLGSDRFLGDILALRMKFYWTIYLLAITPQKRTVFGELATNRLEPIRKHCR